MAHSLVSKHSTLYTQHFPLTVTISEAEGQGDEHLYLSMHKAEPEGVLQI